MPSWNIHTAHVERLLDEHGAEALGVRDPNAFLFGNHLPDVYEGYMVPDVSHKIRYRTTHFADPAFIPTPHFSYFAGIYVDGRDASDVTLGAWAHLVADHIYNRETRRFIDAIGVRPGNETRIRKQGDFDLFGRTLEISSVPEADSGLVDQAAGFPQYAVAAADARAAARVARGIVRANDERHVAGTPTYSLLTPEFFSRTFDLVDEAIAAGLIAHARSGSTAPGMRRAIPGYRALDAQEALIAEADAERRGAESDARLQARGLEVPFADEVVPTPVLVPAPLGAVSAPSAAHAPEVAPRGAAQALSAPPRHDGAQKER